MKFKLYLSLFQKKSFITVIIISLLVWFFLIVQNLNRVSQIKTAMHAHVEPIQHVHHHVSNLDYFSAISHMINLHWFLMLITMMLPLLVFSIEDIFRKNFKRNRKISLALFFLAYAFFWTMIGIILSILTMILNLFSKNQYIIASIILTVLFIWQITPYKKMSLNRCHFAAHINPFGLQAGIDNFKFGIKKAWYCVGACWPFMWLCIAWMEPMMYIMPLFTLFLFIEQMKPKRREKWGFQ